MNWTVVENETKSSALIRVVGVGGAGGNAVNHMVESGIEGVQMICANTDEQALDTNLAELKITLGTGISNGLGAGGNLRLEEMLLLMILKELKPCLRVQIWFLLQQEWVAELELVQPQLLLELPKK